MNSLLSKYVGNRVIELTKSWSSTAAVFGATAGLLGLYFTDWKLVLQYVPLVNRKFRDQ